MAHANHIRARGNSRLNPHNVFPSFASPLPLFPTSSYTSQVTPLRGPEAYAIFTPLIPLPHLCSCPPTPPQTYQVPELLLLTVRSLSPVFSLSFILFFLLFTLLFLFFIPPLLLEPLSLHSLWLCYLTYLGYPLVHNGWVCLAPGNIKDISRSSKACSLCRGGILFSVYFLCLRFSDHRSWNLRCPTQSSC